MEDFEKKLKDSGISEVVGVDESERKRVLLLYKEKKDNPSRLIIRNEKTAEETVIEKEKTEEDERIIKGINTLMTSFVRKYGGTPISVESTNIHFVDHEKLTESEFKRLLGDRGRAQYVQEDQSVFVYENFGSDVSRKAHILAHEILHFNAFQSLVKHGDSFEIRRAGLETRPANPNHNDGDEENKNTSFLRFFVDFNEAITEELTVRFRNEYFSKIGIFPPNREGGEWVIYKKEREKLNELIDDIYDKNRSHFGAREEVFELFASAAMSGKYLPLARIVEKTYGKGVFRKLAKEQDLNKL